PCLGFLLGVIVVQVMPAYLGAAQQVVLAAVDDFQCHTQLLHHGSACAAQIMRRPFTSGSLAQYQRAFMMPAGQRLAAVLEAALPLADELANRLGIDRALAVLAVKADRRMAGFFLQPLELRYGES